MKTIHSQSKAVSARQYSLTKQDARWALGEYRTARAAHFANPDRNPIRREMRLRGLLNYRAAWVGLQDVLARIHPEKYVTYSTAAANSERLRHLSRET